MQIDHQRDVCYSIKNCLVVWNMFYCSIYWEESSQLTNIFQMGWNHQPDHQRDVYYSIKTGWWFETYLFSIIYGMSSFLLPLILFKMVKTFKNHQPVLTCDSEFSR